jgi:hypothetical protein
LYTLRERCHFDQEIEASSPNNTVPCKQSLKQQRLSLVRPSSLVPREGELNERK